MDTLPPYIGNLQQFQPAELDRDELIAELSEANRRLSGTLRVVLGTLDATDVPTLFSRVLEALKETVDATGSVLYLAEREGFRLRASTQSLTEQQIPQYLPYTEELEPVLLARGKPFGLHLVTPSHEELRQGTLTERELESDRDGTHYRIEVRYLLPFTSFILVPVWLGNHVIALIAVGWAFKHRLRRSDGELLEAVARYLSVQLAGAQTALKNEHAALLDQSVIELSNQLNEADALDVTAVCNVLAAACKTLNAQFVLVCDDAREAAAKRTTSTSACIGLPEAGKTPLPEGASTLLDIPAGSETTVVSLEGIPELGAWLTTQGVPSKGAYVDVGELDSYRLRFFVLKAADATPLEDADLRYLRRVGDAVRRAHAGEAEHVQDKRIAQALQLGMRSSLQKVEGIAAEGVYSSATADAYVGGDFYDLIRLPHNKACVIMGDVSGKGVEAASISAGVRTALGAYAWQELAPATMVRNLNNYLLGFSRVETFATLFVGMIDLQKHELQYCSAGHPPAFVRRAKTGELELLSVQSGMVGAFEDMRYRNGSLSFDRGDLLFLYTDGATEARNTDGSFLGETGLTELLLEQTQSTTDSLPERMLEVIDAFTGHRLDDDIALVSLVFEV